MLALRTRSSRFARSVAAGAVACIMACAPATRIAAQELPSRLDDSTYWKLITDFSEPGGYFRSDNFVSNEMAFQYVIPTFLQTTKPEGVYLGVGPDQNFTYIVALKPKLAFIFDIRRGNLQEHLLYKAVIEMSDNRADFLSRLFSRPRPAGLDSTASADSLLMAYARVPASDSLYRRNLKAVKEWLTAHHHFALGDSDLVGIEYVYSAFSEAGPELTYNFGGGRAGNFRGFGRGMPTYADLMVQTDGQGAHRSYIASEANYRALRQHELDNAIVPIVGNFAGDKAIKAVAGYLRERHATVTAFYLSNVEQYLWGNGSDDGRKFFANVETLPLDSASTFIRAVFNGGGFRGGTGGGGMRGPTILASMMGQLAAFHAGHINSYYDVVQYSK